MPVFDKFVQVAVLTGLPRGEIEVLTIGHLELDSDVPLIRMESKDTKTGEADEIPLPERLAYDLREWLESRLDSAGGGIRNSDVIPITAKRQEQSFEESLFTVPRQIVKTLNRDLDVAGIDKEDDRKRTVDFHSLRHSFGTLLSSHGVAPRTAQQAMRHSTIDLTMNVYTDARMLNVAGAIDSLPSLPFSNHLVPSDSE